MLKNRVSRLLFIAGCMLLSCACFGGSVADKLLPHSLVKRIATDGPGVPIVVFNPLSWERTDAVDVETPFPGQSPHVKITDSAGKAYPARTLGDRLHFTARSVPALGYRVYWAERVAKPVATPIKCTADSIENQFFRVDIDKTRAVITGIYDKANSRQLMPTNASAALQIARGSKIKSISEDATTTMMDSGPARGLIILDSTFGSHSLVQELILHDGVPRVDIRMTSEWSEPQATNQPTAALRVTFPTRLTAAKPTKGGIEVFEDGAKVPGVRWIDVTANNYGISLLADNVHALDCNKGVLAATLRKQGDAAYGAWEINYSIYTHKNDHQAARVFEHSLEVATPLIAKVTTRHSGDLPRTWSIVSYNRPGLLAALSPAEAPILRFYETIGDQSGVSVKINVSGIKLTPADPSGQPIPNVRPVIERTLNLTPSAKSPVTYIFSWED